jgi:tetratricopeptide (TPR) repeat protein
MSKNKNKQQPIAVKPNTEKKSPNIFLIKLFLVAVVIMLYGQSINFQFTLDDDLFYLKHKSVQQGMDGVGDIFSKGSLNQFDGTTGVQPYRPVTLTVFAIQKTLFDNSPSAAHFINMFFYILVVLVVFELLRKLFSSFHVYIIALMALLFVVHPIHTEVVSSVKSMDELLAALFGFMAWRFFLDEDAIKKNSLLYIGVGSILYFLSLLSKESAIAFLIIIPLSLIMIQKKEIKPSLITLIPLGFMTLLFLIIRQNVIGTSTQSNGLAILENVLNASTSIWQTTATKSVILFHYIRLLFVPWPLTWDYSFNQIPLVNWTSVTAWMGLIIYGVLFITAILQFKKQPLLSFLILFFFISSSPTNNLFLINGATIGERFLFVPSFAFTTGFILFLANVFKINFDDFSGKNKTVFSGLAILILLVFAVLSSNRTADWKSNLLLFEKGVERSPNSSRAQYSLATEYLTQSKEVSDITEKNNYLQQSLIHFNKSLEILPENKLSHYNSGLCYVQLGDTNNAIIRYKRAIELDSNYIMPVNNLGVLYQARQEFDAAQQYYELALKIDPNAKTPVKNLGDLFIMKGIYYSQLGDNVQAMNAYLKSMTYNSNNTFLLNNIASLYSSLNKNDSSLIYLKKAYLLEPQNLLVIQNIAAVSYLSKNYNQAIEYAQKALVINGNLKKSFGVLADTYTALGNIKEATRYRQLYNQSK